MFLTAESNSGIQAFLRYLDPAQMDDSVLRILLPVMAVLSVIVVLLIVFRFTIADKRRSRIYKYPFMSVFMKTSAIVGTLLLAASDFFAVSTLFADSKNVVGWTPVALSLTFAAFLEGGAFLLGIFVSRLADPTQYRSAEKVFSIIGMVIALVGLVLAWALAVWMRKNSMVNDFVNQGYMTNTETEWQQWDYIIKNGKQEDIFMMCSPVLTSILATGLSWLAFPSDFLGKQQRTVEYQRNRYLQYRKRYQKYLLRYRQDRSKLWTTLSSETEAIDPSLPADPDLFQSRCQQMIRQKTVSACVNAFSDEFGRYNKQVESLLGEFIQELSLRSTLPYLISEITVQEVLQAYEAEMASKNLTDEFWDNRNLRLSKMERLRRELDNAAHRAEFRYHSRRK